MRGKKTTTLYWKNGYNTSHITERCVQFLLLPSWIWPKRPLLQKT